MIDLLLNICQPITVIIFIVAGILSFMRGLTTQGVIDICFAITNFFVFYGLQLLKK